MTDEIIVNQDGSENVVTSWPQQEQPVQETPTETPAEKPKSNDAVVKINEEYIKLYFTEKEKCEALSNINTQYRIEIDSLRTRIEDLDKLIRSYEMIIRSYKLTSSLEPVVEIPEEKKKSIWKNIKGRFKT